MKPARRRQYEDTANARVTLTIAKLLFIAHDRERLHADDRGQRQADARGDLRGADGTAETGGKYQESEKFDTLWYGGCFGRSEVIVPQGQGA